MAYGIIQNHDGAINVYSEVGVGSTLKVYLPALGEKVTEEKIEFKELPRGSETILLVDDEKHVRNVGRDMLENFGYRIHLAKNGTEACKIYEEKIDEIDLVLLDIVMPEMDGKKTYRRLKEIDSAVKAILISGYSINDRVREILDEGAMDFVQKPFDAKKITPVIRKVLDA